MYLPRPFVVAALGAAIISGSACADRIAGPSPAPALPSSSGYILLPEQGARAYAGLQRTSDFYSAAVGADSLASMHARWFRILLAFPNAAAIFRQLWRGASPAGRLYALMGLQLTDPASYRALAHFSLEDRTLITWWDGSAGRQVSVSEIAVQIETSALAATFQRTAERATRDARQDSIDAAFEEKWHIGRVATDGRP